MDNKETELVDMYIGQKKIRKVEQVAEGTFIEYEDNSKETIPFEMYKGIVTVVPLDESGIWHKRCQTVTKRLIEVMLHYGVKMDEVEHIADLIKTSILESHGEAINKLFGMKWKDRKLSDLDKILRGN